MDKPAETLNSLKKPLLKNKAVLVLLLAIFLVLLVNVGLFVLMKKARQQMPGVYQQSPSQACVGDDAVDAFSADGQTFYFIKEGNLYSQTSGGSWTINAIYQRFAGGPCSSQDCLIDAFSKEGNNFRFIKNGRLWTFDINTQTWTTPGTAVSNHPWFGTHGGPCFENPTCVIDAFSADGQTFYFIKEGNLYSQTSGGSWTVNPIYQHGWFGSGGPCSSQDCLIDAFSKEGNNFRFIKDGRLWTFDSSKQQWTTPGTLLSDHPWFGSQGGPCYIAPSPSPSPTPNALDNLGQQLGFQISYNGSVDNLQITEIEGGVYQIKANAFPCTPGTSGCEPDRYQVTFDKNIPFIFGLGREVLPRVALGDFLDLNFSIGHYPMHTGEYRYSGDNGRLRIPMFVLPKEKTIIAYIQPEVKRVRLTRTANSTEIVAKRHEQYPGGGPGTLFLIKGNSTADAYQKYNSYLKQAGYFFKKPHFKAFGLGWETYDEYGGCATANDIRYALDQYKAAGIKLDMITIGTGYWQNGKYADDRCGGGDYGGILDVHPTIDVLQTSPVRYGGKTGLQALWDELLSEGVYPMIGMRHGVGAVDNDNRNFIINKFAQKDISNPLYLSGHVFPYGNAPSKNAAYIDTRRPEVASAYVDFLIDAYGTFKGIKEDEMFLGDQLANGGSANFPDGLASKIFRFYDEKFNNDFISIGSSDYFSAGTDLQEVYGWENSTDKNLYYVKNNLEAALTQIASGYPHPNFQGYLLNDRTYNGDQQKEFLRAIQLQTFVAGNTQSKGFWHLTNNDYKNGVIYFSKLRGRLQQYAYDQTQKWYQTGIPALMRLLYIDYPDDNNVYELYTQLTGNTATTPKDEYMFGNALLVRPVYNDTDTVTVYLPAGDWLPFFKDSSIISGNKNISYAIQGVQDYPVFLKKGQLLLIQENEQLNNLQAYFFLNDSQNSEEYTLYKKEGGMVRLQAYKKGDGAFWVKRLDNGREVQAVSVADRGYLVASLEHLLTSTPDPACQYDYTEDGTIDFNDLLDALSHWGTVGIAGFLGVLSGWGVSCG